MGFYVTNWRMQGQSVTEIENGGQFVLMLFTVACCLQPVLLNVHTDGHICLFMCVAYAQAQAR